jgi:hypothetical protein
VATFTWIGWSTTRSGTGSFVIPAGVPLYCEGAPWHEAAKRPTAIGSGSYGFRSGSISSVGIKYANETTAFYRLPVSGGATPNEDKIRSISALTVSTVGPLQIRFTHTSAVETQNAQFYATTNPAAVPASGSDPTNSNVYAFTAGSTSWTCIDGVSGTPLSVVSAGLSTTHDFDVAFSIVPTVLGNTSSGAVLNISLEYF